MICSRLWPPLPRAQLGKVVPSGKRGFWACLEAFWRGIGLQVVLVVGPPVNAGNVRLDPGLKISGVGKCPHSVSWPRKFPHPEGATEHGIEKVGTG